MGRRYGRPLALNPERDQYGRYDLASWLADGAGGQCHTQYHRVVGLALKKTSFDKRGREALSHYARPADQHGHEVDHVDWDPYNCRLSNLMPLPIFRHRGEGRDR